MAGIRGFARKGTKSLGAARIVDLRVTDSNIEIPVLLTHMLSCYVGEKLPLGMHYMRGNNQ